jgi:hypothetical protein
MSFTSSCAVHDLQMTPAFFEFRFWGQTGRSMLRKTRPFEACACLHDCMAGQAAGGDQHPVTVCLKDRGIFSGHVGSHGRNCDQLTYMLVVAGGFDPNTAVEPNTVPLGDYVSVCMQTRTCNNDNATFTTNDTCTTPVQTRQDVFCQVRS